jgi:pentatricopeptide repeat protein
MRPTTCDEGFIILTTNTYLPPTAEPLCNRYTKPLTKTVAKTVARGNNTQLLISINTAMAACSAAGEPQQARALLDGMLTDSDAPGTSTATT